MLIRIQQHDFILPDRYQPGHVLTDGEAAAMNQLLAENIRNNVSGWVNKSLQYLETTVLPPASHAQLQSRIEEYAHQYQFRRRERSRPPSPIEVAADEIALREAEIQGQQQGHTPGSMQTLAIFNRLRRNPAIMERARELVASRQAITNQSLKDILGDTQK